MFQLFEFPPFKRILVCAFPQEKPIAFRKQICIWNIRQKISADFMILKAIDIFFEKALIKPKRTRDSGCNA